MALTDQILDDLKKAMRAKDELTKDVLRMLKADLMNREVELGADLAETDEVAVLKRCVKMRQDSAAQFEEGGRQDAADKERAEIAILERYLPTQLSPEETEAKVLALIEELGLSGKKDMGRLMKELKSRHGASLDGRTASGIAARLLDTP